jgi:hypothetical protein
MLVHEWLVLVRMLRIKRLVLTYHGCDYGKTAIGEVMLENI